LVYCINLAANRAQFHHIYLALDTAAARAKSKFTIFGASTIEHHTFLFLAYSNLIRGAGHTDKYGLSKNRRHYYRTGEQKDKGRSRADSAIGRAIDTQLNGRGFESQPGFFPFSFAALILNTPKER